MPRTVVARPSVVALALAQAGCAEDATPRAGQSRRAVAEETEETETPAVEFAPIVAVGEDPVGVAAGAGDVVWVVSFGPSELRGSRPTAPSPTSPSRSATPRCASSRRTTPCG